MKPLLESLRGSLIVSCQAYPGEPLRDTAAMTLMALAVERGGARAIRAQGLADVASICAAVSVPVIGLVKEGDRGVYITPTVELARATARAGAHIVAVDATDRPRPDGRPVGESVRAIHDEGALAMADVSTLEEAVAAASVGFDMVSTTLSGYTEHSADRQGPDLALVADAVSALGIPVIAEGRYHSPSDAVAAIRAGAHAVVVGTAITHPTSITRWFAEAVHLR